MLQLTFASNTGRAGVLCLLVLSTGNCKGSSPEAPAGVSDSATSDGQIADSIAALDALDASDASTSLRLPDYWQRETQCLLVDPTLGGSGCVAAGAGDYVYLADKRIRHIYWSSFNGPGTGGVGSALSTDGGKTFAVEPGLRIASTGVTGQTNFNVDQSVVFTRTSGGWGALIGQYASKEDADGPTSTWLYTTPDGYTFTPVGAVLGKGSLTESTVSFVGRGSAFRPTSGGALRGLITCNLVTNPRSPSDVCTVISADDGASWQFDAKADVGPWKSADRGKTWTRDDKVRNGTVFTGGNEAFVFPIKGGFGMLFSYLAHGVFASTSSDGIHWSAPRLADVRNPDGSSCYYADPNGDGVYSFQEDQHNCEPGDPSVLVRSDGSLVFTNARPAGKDGTGGGFYGYVGVYK